MFEKKTLRFADVDRGLHDIVVKNMIHGPCGELNENSPCMDRGRCSKQYPRILVPNTSTGNDGTLYIEEGLPKMVENQQS